MFVLQIEHGVPSYEEWKKSFDNDPVGRKKMGVQRYRIMRPVGNPNFTVIELEFESADKAEALLSSLQSVWAEVDGTVMRSPQTRIVEIVEAKVL